jgi:hypothetical protein
MKKVKKLNLFLHLFLFTKTKITHTSSPQHFLENYFPLKSIIVTFPVLRSAIGSFSNTFSLKTIYYLLTYLTSTLDMRRIYDYIKGDVITGEQKSFRHALLSNFFINYVIFLYEKHINQLHGKHKYF